MDNRRMKQRHIILAGIIFAICGNVFAYSPYTNTITNNLPKKSFLTAAAFPTTVADTNFVERVESKAIGYEPYFNRSAFTELSIEELDELETMIHRAEIEQQYLLRTLPISEYCAIYYTDAICVGTVYAEYAGQTQGYQYTANPEYDNLLYMSAALSQENINNYKLAAYNGRCTPSVQPSNKNLDNRILTSGRYANTDPAFEKFMIAAFRKEGECGKDVGGWACYGCHSSGLCAGIDMNTVTRSKVEDLAYQNIYIKDNIYKLPDAFRGYAMWGIWGSGSVIGANIFQRALGIQETGKIDDKTIQAATEYRGDFAYAYFRAQKDFYDYLIRKEPEKFSRFRNGWYIALELLPASGCHFIPQQR